MTDSLWFHRPRPDAAAAVRLFCFPHAGGGTTAYRAWTGGLAEHIDVTVVRLPGREIRFVEPRYRRMGDLVADLCAVLRRELDRPYAFFGHSLGALIAHEAACHLVETGNAAPRRLFAAACRAPQLRLLEPPLYALPPDLFVRRVGEFGGMPAEVLGQAELVAALLPTIRDDFEIAETYRPAPVGRLACPVTAIGGKADASVPEADLAAWRQVTRGPFELDLVHGDHFCVHQEESGVAWTVAERLREV